MKFVSSRELRNNPGFIRDAVAEDDVVLTANGRPFALLVGLEEEELEETLDLLRRVRAEQAISRLQRSAAERGVDRLSVEEIEEEIRRARAERGRGG